MALLNRLPTNHTVRGFRTAARLRYSEAERLANAGDRLAGVYLCGYAAEMLLKAAFFRLQGKQPNDPITIHDLRIAMQQAQSMYQKKWHNLHDLGGWAALLTDERRRLGIAYPPRLSRVLNAQVKRIQQNWREDLRYHSNRPYLGEMRATFEGVAWLSSQFHSL
jgi:hypothetical protein